jgi:hypothetical protein
MPPFVAHLVVLTIAATLWVPRAEAGICVNVDLHSTSPSVSRSMLVAVEREAAAIWAPYGVDLHGASSACAVEDASFDVLIARSLPHAATEALVLGTTRVDLTPIAHVPILIDYEATERTIASLTIGALTEEIGIQRIGAREMGRALGRVLAHEIGHVLLAMPTHQRHGLMRETYKPIDMVYPLRVQYRLSPDEVARLRQRFEWITATRTAASSDPGRNASEGRGRTPGREHWPKNDR